MVQNHFSVVAVDTDLARREMSTVATLTIVRSFIVSLRVSLVKEEESVRRPFQFKFTVKYTLKF